MPTKAESESHVVFQPATTKRASEIIFEQIREMIIRGDLKPGDRLPNERSMMEMFGRSRPTVREALRMLERGGYIRANAGSNGATVMEPSTENLEDVMQDALEVGHVSITDMHEYRLVSENAAMVWACERRTDEDLDALREQLELMADNLHNFENYVRMDADFHTLIAGMTKNCVSQIINKTLSVLNRNFMLAKATSMTAAEQEDMLQRVHAMHVKIFEALETRDVDMACKAMEEHLLAFENDLKE